MWKSEHIEEMKSLLFAMENNTYEEFEEHFEIENDMADIQIGTTLKGHPIILRFWRGYSSDYKRQPILYVNWNPEMGHHGIPLEEGGEKTFVVPKIKEK